MDTSQALITYPGPLTVVPAAATPDPENVAQLAAILGLPEDQALQLLEASGGDLERAVALGLGESSTSYNVPQMDIKYDPTVSAATMWGLNVTLDLERKASSRTALNKKKGDLPPGIAFEDHSGAFVWLNTVLQALNGALLARPGDARAALFASAATDSPSKPADYLAELIAMLSRTQRAAVSAKRVADSLGAHSALTTNLADMVTKVLDGVDLAAIRVAFRTTVTDTKSFLDEAKNIIFSELEGGRSLSFPDLNASHVIGAGCIEDVLRKRFGASNAQPNASGEAKVTFIEDESAHPPDLLFLNLDTQFRGRLEGHLALDPFCRTLASSGVSDLASVESEIASILARLDKLKPAKQRHLKALLQHLRGVRRQDTIPALERLIGVHESIRDELETRHSELTLRRNDIFLASKHLYSLRCVFLDGPPRLLFDTGSSWLVFTDDKVELGAFPDGIVAARGVIYARTHSMDVPESVPEALPTWIEQALQEDEAALEAALRPIDLTLELPFAPAQTDDGEAVPIILDEVEDPKVELPDSEEKP